MFNKQLFHFFEQRELHLNQKNGHIRNDSKAMKLWSREYEKGWELKI